MKSSSKLKILSIFVIISTCIQYSLSQDYPGLDDYPGDYSEEPLACAEPDYSGDGICDDQNNNADCDFDGGDCCGPHVDKTFCIKCECLEDDQEPDENFLDFFRSLSHVPQYHPDPTTKPPSQDFLAQQFLLQQGVTYQPSTENKTCPGHPICNGHGKCLDGVCHCLHGHTGDGCETPPTGSNPCTSDPICNGHGSCSYGGSKCHCKHGYTGDGCEIPPINDPSNPCHSDPICNGHGSCPFGGSKCHCKHGYTGDGCENPPIIDPLNPCHSDPICNGHGSCPFGGSKCHCLHGYTGDGCEIPPGPIVIDPPPNPCHSDPICNGHGSCSYGGSKCHCLHGYTGDGCEIPSTGPIIDPPPNPCHSDPICNGHGSCSYGGSKCHCLHGYTGDGCEIPPGGGGGPCRLECNGQPCNSDNTACDCQNGSSEPDCSDFDPHGNKTHCVDVSTYTYPVWVKEPRKCCSTEFVKKEHKRWEEVCMNVTSLYCDVWPSTECEMKMSNVTLNTTTWQYVYFPKITCVPTYKKVVHMKKKPYCIKKPKYHCTSKWKMLPSGEKIWDGYDNCTVIYWDDCKLVDYNETIKVETPQCNVTHKIPYMTIVKKPTIEMVYKMECQVIKKTHCKAKTDESCKTIDYTETKEEPVKNCEHTYIKKPEQEREHKTKCLFMKNDYLQKTHLTNGLLGGSLF